MGVSESGIETFKGAPYGFLAREICQNSLDAKLDQSKPVTVEFQKIYVNNYTIPGYEQLKDDLERCLDFWEERHNKKATDFFRKAAGSFIRKEYVSWEIAISVRPVSPGWIKNMKSRIGKAWY